MQFSASWTQYGHQWKKDFNTITPAFYSSEVVADVNWERVQSHLGIEFTSHLDIRIPKTTYIGERGHLLWRTTLSEVALVRQVQPSADMIRDMHC